MTEGIGAEIIIAIGAKRMALPRTHLRAVCQTDDLAASWPQAAEISAPRLALTRTV